MIRIVILSLLAVLAVILVLRFAPRLRALLLAVMRHPLLRYIPVGLVLRLVRLLIFRR